MTRPRQPRRDGLTPGRRVSTGTPGVYRNVSTRGPEFDTFTPRVYDPDNPKSGRWLGTFGSLSQAEEARRDAMGMPNDLRFVTVREFVTRYWRQLFEDKRLDLSWRNSMYGVKPFVAEFGDRRPADIGILEARAWAVSAPRGQLAAARAMLNDAAKVGLLHHQKNPLAYLGLKQSTGRRDQLPPNVDVVLDMAALAETPEYGYWGREFASLIRFAVATLLRPSEIIELKWTDLAVDLDSTADLIEATRHLRRDGTVGNRKTHREAIVALLPPARAALAQVPRRLDSPFIYHAPNRKQLNYSTLNYQWKRLRAYCAAHLGDKQLLELEFYDATKHAGASWLRNVMGIPKEEIKTQLGHVNDKHVDLYSHPEAAAAAVRVHRAFERAEEEAARRAASDNRGGQVT